MEVGLPSSCALCPRRCGADRAAGQRGACGADGSLRVARAALHEWEEPGISVGAGSGAVFFSNCALRCAYCQNHDIAHGGWGAEVSAWRLAAIFGELALQGAANLNLVTPTHYLPPVRDALALRGPEAGRLPVVCNTSGYELARVVRGFSGCFDVYLTDFKYWRDGESDAARRYSHAPDYFDVALPALREMAACAGEPAWDEFAGEPRLVRGVVVRHLLLPGRLEDAKRILACLWSEFGGSVLYSVMDQYTPLRAHPGAPELDVRPDARDYEQLLDFLDDLGMDDYFWQQGGAAKESFIPAFDGTGV